jgi:phosphoglycolate phosphatase
MSGRDMMKHLNVPTWKLPLIVTHMRKLKTRDIHTISLFPGAPRMMRTLHDAGVRLAIVSSNAPHNVEKVLGPDNTRLVDYMDCGGSVFGKASMLAKVVRQSGVAPQRALCIGDEIRDMEAAKSAGIPFGAVAWGYTKLSALQTHRPKETFATMEEIAERVI